MRGLPPEYRPEPVSGAVGLHALLFLDSILTAAASVTIIMEPRAIWGYVGLLLFGFAAVVHEAERRSWLDERARARLAPFLRRGRRPDVDGYAWLLRVLADLDGRTPRARRRSRIALDLITGNESLMDGLFVRAHRREINVAVFVDRLGRLGAGVLVPALASLHPDGRIRETALAAMARRFRPAHLSFLVERAVDWVPEVRMTALNGLRTQLGRHPDLLPQGAAACARIAQRKHAAALIELINELSAGPPPAAVTQAA